MHSEWEVPLDEVVVLQHRESLGALSNLVASIAAAGLVRPVLITEDGRVIAGARRIAAMRELGETHIPAVVASELSQAVEVLEGDLKEQEGQAPMPWLAKARLGMVLEDLPRKAGIGDSRSWVARGIGTGAHGWQRVRHIWMAVENGELDLEVFDEIEQTDSPTTVWKRLMAERSGEPPPDPRAKTWNLNTDRNVAVAEKSRERFSTALGALDGYRAGLQDMVDKGELAKVLALADEKEIEDWRGILGKTNRTLGSVRAQLKGSQ